MRKWFSIISTLFTLVIVLIVVGVWQWNSLLDELELEDVQFQLQKYSRDEIQFSKVDFIYRSKIIKIKAELNNINIHLKWNGWLSPSISLISLENIRLNELNKNSSTQHAQTPQTPQTPFSIPAIEKIPASFPEQIHIKHYTIEVTCPTGTCSMAGELDLRLSNKLPDTTAINLDLKIAPNETLHSFAQFSGSTKIDLDITAGKINRYLLSGDIHAEHLNIPENWKAQGINANAVHFNIHSKSDLPISINALPLAFSGEIQGTLQSRFSGDLNIDIVTKKINIEKCNLSATVPELKPTQAITLNGININLQAAGHWQPDSVEFRASEASLTIAVVNHPQLKNSAWNWQGKFQGAVYKRNVDKLDVDKFDLNGALMVGKSMTINHHMQYNASELVVDWQMPDIFLLAANPFAEILNAWPPLASLTRGKINANGSLLFNTQKNTFVKSKSDIQLQDLSGIYDTVAFQGINTKLNMSINEKSFHLATKEMKVEEIDKGFVMGPMQMSGRYQAALNKLTQGKLMLEQFNSTAMGGSIATSAQEFDFSREKQNITLELKNIDLATLLKQHSSSELTGNGQLSGTVPLEITGTSVRILEGLVSAQEPGGQLKYSSERARAIAKAQPSMKLVTEALSDFHYSVLTSNISYDETGKLRLGVRLEGSSPAVENGRPINFNVNIEEDVPAMLASIQLSGKVTDVIRKRLQERTQKKTSTKTAP
jgi:hypothetical protein